MIIVFAIIAFTIPLIIKLFIDFNKWKNHQPVNHSKEWIFTAIGEIPCGCLFLYPILPLFNGDYLEYGIAIIYRLIVIGSMCGFWFWFLFDGLYNIKRKFNWWFTGSDDPDDATADNFLQSLKKWQQIAFKLGTIILFTILYIIEL